MKRKKNTKSFGDCKSPLPPRHILLITDNNFFINKAPVKKVRVMKSMFISTGEDILEMLSY